MMAVLDQLKSSVAGLEAAAEQIVELPVDRVHPDPEQVRVSLRDDPHPDKNPLLQDLLDSIKANGLVQPITVYPHPDPERSGHYQILVGERRYRACCLAGLAVVRSIVTAPPASEADKLYLQLAENDLRQDLTLLERAEAVRRLLERHNVTEVARRLRMSKPQLSNLKAVLGYDDLTRALVQEQLLTNVFTARLFSQLPQKAARRLASAAREASVPIGRPVLERTLTKNKPVHDDDEPAPPKPRSPRHADTFTLELSATQLSALARRLSIEHDPHDPRSIVVTILESLLTP